MDTDRKKYRVIDTETQSVIKDNINREELNRFITQHGRSPVNVPSCVKNKMRLVYKYLIEYCD